VSFPTKPRFQKWRVKIITDPTKEADQKSLGTITFRLKLRRVFVGKTGPCIDAPSACDSSATDSGESYV